MANKKFSEFNLKTDPADVDFVVGYDGSENVRIDPANLGGGGGAVAFLTPESQGTVSSVNIPTPVAMMVNDWSNYGTSGELYTDSNGESLVSVGDTLALQSLNGNYTTPVVTVSNVSGFGYIEFNGDLGSNALMSAEGWNVWSNDNLNAIINISSVLSFVTTNGVLYVTESGVNFTGNGTNTVNADLNVNDKIYLNSIPLVDGGQTLYDPITGEYNASGQLKEITESGNTGYRIYNENFANYYGTIGDKAIDLTLQDFQQNRGATGEYSVAIGKGCLASNDNSTAIGFNVQATGNTSFAAGMGGNVSGYASVGIGASNTVSGSNSAAIGHNNTTTNNLNYAFGYLNRILGTAQYTTSIGFSNNNSGTAAVSIGVSNTIPTQNTVAIGNSNNTTGSSSSSICIGNTNIASGNYAIAIGTGVNATGVDSIAIGTVSQATNLNSLSVGEGCISSGFRSSALGYKSITSGNDQTVIGTENDSNANAQFIIGNGLAGNKSNSFEILYDGTVVIKDLPGSTSYSNDVDAAAGGVPIGGLYRHNNDLKVRLT
jgi:hypothetical protein